MSMGFYPMLAQMREREEKSTSSTEMPNGTNQTKTIKSDLMGIDWKYTM